MSTAVTLTLKADQAPCAQRLFKYPPRNGLPSTRLELSSTSGIERILIMVATSSPDPRYWLHPPTNPAIAADLRVAAAAMVPKLVETQEPAMADKVVEIQEIVVPVLAIKEVNLLPAKVTKLPKPDKMVESGVMKTVNLVLSPAQQEVKVKAKAKVKAKVKVKGKALDLVTLPKRLPGLVPLGPPPPNLVVHPVELLPVAVSPVETPNQAVVMVDKPQLARTEK